MLVYKCGQKKWNNLYYQIYDRSIVASVDGISIHTELEKNALEKALKSEKPREGLILHSDQGCQFTSWEFVSYCKEKKVVQSLKHELKNNFSN